MVCLQHRANKPTSVPPLCKVVRFVSLAVPHTLQITSHLVHCLKHHLSHMFSGHQNVASVMWSVYVVDTAGTVGVVDMVDAADVAAILVRSGGGEAGNNYKSYCGHIASTHFLLGLDTSARRACCRNRGKRRGEQ